MTIWGGFTNKPLPSPQQAMQVSASPKANAVINAAIQQSVQEFPPATNTGSFFAQIVRGPILPPYGTKDRDYVLRLMFRNEYNNLVQAVVSALIKKVATIPTELHGDKKKNLFIPDAGKMKSISAVEYYENILANAQFGAGWEAFISRFLEDFFTQDIGGIIELSGLGDPTGAIQGPITGIAQLDVGRSYVTGHPVWPIMYFSLISGSLHRMHARRIIRLVDTPSPDERYFGIGLCALSRTIAVANRQQYMNRYIESLVDDKPKPGILSVSNMTQPQWDKLTGQYTRSLQSDAPGTFGKTLVVMGMDVEKEIKINHMPFSDTPEKFDWVKYTELDVHALAAGFNIDVQEIWELTGRQGMGSTAQSQVLHQKSEAKMQGFLIKTIESLFNRHVFGDSGIVLEMKYNDPIQRENDATIDGQISTNAVNLLNVGIMSQQEARLYLTLNSDRFKDTLNNEDGELVGPDASDSTVPEVVESTDNMPPPELDLGDPPPKVAPTQEQPLQTRAQNATPPPKPLVARTSQPRKQRAKTLSVKAFSITAADFIRQFTSAFSRALNDSIDQDRFETMLLDLLSVSSVKAFRDGLKSGGVNALPDADEQRQIQDFLVDQIDYIDNLATAVFSGKLDASVMRDRAQMWVNKSLRQMYQAGLLAADANGMYEWQYGDTKHCEDCLALNGQVHRLKDWNRSGFMPQSDTLACRGFKCGCKLIKTDKSEQGDY